MSWENRDYNRSEQSGSGIPPIQFRFPPITTLTVTLIAVNFALFLLKPIGRPYEYAVEFGALRWNWEVWRWITYQYLHANAGHVFFNMLGLYFFLPPLERRWGWQKAFAFYTLGGMAAAAVFLGMLLAFGRYAELIGASGSVFAILGAVALLYPERQLILLVFPVPIRVAAALFAGFFLLTVIGDADYSNGAHLGGLVFGFAAPLIGGPWIERQQRNVAQWRGQRAQQSELDEQTAVDQILAKVARSGMQSLTSREKKTLQRASDNQRLREQTHAKRYGR